MRTLDLAGTTVQFSTLLPPRLSRLAEEFALVWATGREHGARALAAELALGELPVISFAGAAARRGRTWKLAAVRDFVGNRPVAWLDDAFGDDAHRWADQRPEPTRLIDVNPAWGLVDAHLGVLLRFALEVGR
jgi:hypothetical protein